MNISIRKRLPATKPGTVFGIVARLRQQIGRVAHQLHFTRDDDLRIAGLNGPRPPRAGLRREKFFQGTKIFSPGFDLRKRSRPRPCSRLHAFPGDEKNIRRSGTLSLDKGNNVKTYFSFNALSPYSMHVFAASLHSTPVDLQASLLRVARNFLVGFPANGDPLQHWIGCIDRKIATREHERQKKIFKKHHFFLDIDFL